MNRPDYIWMEDHQDYQDIARLRLKEHIERKEWLITFVFCQGMYMNMSMSSVEGNITKRLC